MKKIIVTENPAKWQIEIEDTVWMDPTSYLSDKELASIKNVKIINLCNSYQYQSTGYYISLLAEARGHKVLPTTSTVMDFRFQGLIKEDLNDFEDIIQQVLSRVCDSRLEVTIFFGFTENLVYSKIGLLLFNLYQSPFMRVSFVKKEKWLLQNLKPVNLKELTGSEIDYMRQPLKLFMEGKRIVTRSYSRKQYDLAIMVGTDDPTPPSDAKAIQKFMKAAEKIGFSTEIISKNDYGKLTQFDALFIRETTNVDHHTYRFSRKARAEGLAVIDDPDSIMKCTNKVYLNELMNANKIPVPRSFIIRKGQKKSEFKDLIFPLVLKIPDGSFSKGVKKVSSFAEFENMIREYFKTTDLVIAQEFMPTEFDWRVGVLNGKPLYLCKYYMASNHWQIVDWQEGKASTRLGKSETIPIEEAPHGLIQLAIKSAGLIGKSLYGVDIKQVGRKFYVIEVNDNPSIESGIEDKVEKNRLYDTLMRYLLNQVQNKSDITY